MLIFITIYLLAIRSLLYFMSGKVRGKPFVPVNAVWIFDLIERTFKQNNSSAKEVKENELS